MRSSRRFVAVRTLVVLAITFGMVVGLATTAEAKRINSVKGLKKSCAKGSGTYTQGAGGTSALCDLPGGKTIVCSDKQRKCTAVDTIKRELVVEDGVITPDGVKLTTQPTPDSQEWSNRAGVDVLTDVCASVGGDFITSAEGSLGACAIPAATVVCTDTSGTCAGVAPKKVVRDLLRVLIDSFASCRVSTPSPSQPTATSSTTTTSTPEPTTTTTEGASIL